MAINKKLIHFKTKQKFNEELAKGNILNTSIVFIQDTTEIYTHGQLYDGSTFDPTDIEASIQNIIDNYATKAEIPTKVSQLKNDANYIQDDIVSDGVYAVDANGKLIDYNTADTTATGVALVAGEHKFMIAKSDATDGSNSTLYWGKNLYQKDVAGITNISSGADYIGEGKKYGTDFTTWSTGPVVDFNGAANTAAIIAGYTEHGVSMDARDMCTVLNTFNASDGYNDWYVPACGQLALMYLAKTDINAALAKIGGTAFNESINYWSSSEVGAGSAWYVSFGGGFVYGSSKDNGFRVRFIRDISVKPLKERVIELEQSIPTKVSQLENDKNYIENGDGYNSGVYIAVQSGKLINPDEYDSTTETAVGVAVIDPKANFIIGLNHTASIPWGTSAQGLFTDISGLTNYNSPETAATDMDGIANTEVITAIYSGTDCAAGLAKSQTITYGDLTLTGYLGSAGEWQIVINNYEVVKSVAATIGGNILQSTPLCYWTSNVVSSTIALFANFMESNQDLSGTSKSSSFSYYCAVPFYKIDNETLLSKINSITTPTGSDQYPIYIDNQGNPQEATNIVAKKVGTSTVGSTTRPIYLSSGTPTEGSTYAGGTKVTLNGISFGGDSISFYAPRTISYGRVLVSQYDTTNTVVPVWSPTITIKNIKDNINPKLSNGVYIITSDGIFWSIDEYRKSSCGDGHVVIYHEGIAFIVYSTSSGLQSAAMFGSASVTARSADTPRVAYSSINDSNYQNYLYIPTDNVIIPNQSVTIKNIQIKGHLGTLGEFFLVRKYNTLVGQALAKIEKEIIPNTGYTWYYWVAAEDPNDYTKAVRMSASSQTVNGRTATFFGAFSTASKTSYSSSNGTGMYVPFMRLPQELIPNKSIKEEINKQIPIEIKSQSTIEVECGHFYDCYTSDNCTIIIPDKTDTVQEINCKLITKNSTTLLLKDVSGNSIPIINESILEENSIYLLSIMNHIGILIKIQETPQLTINTVTPSYQISKSTVSGSTYDYYLTYTITLTLEHPTNEDVIYLGTCRKGELGTYLGNLQIIIPKGSNTATNTVQSAANASSSDPEDPNLFPFSASFTAKTLSDGLYYYEDIHI